MNWLEARIEEWHQSGEDSGELYEYLGMTPELYKRWVEKPFKYVLGIDEVGYGALAGPLVLGGAYARWDWTHEALRDSKAFKGKKGAAERARARALEKLKDEPVKLFIHRTPVERVDELGVVEARSQAVREITAHVISMLEEPMVVFDGDVRIDDLEHVCLKAADTFVPQVMAASMVAKLTRDEEMRRLSKEYPAYDFGENKGYNSKTHEDALVRLGLCPIHRRSYKMKFLRPAASSLRRP